MSQPRRRRRRRRKPGGEGAQKPRQEGGGQVREQASTLDAPGGSNRSRNRKRRRRGGTGPGVGSPKSSEDLVRALPRERPTQLTAPPDGQSLETIIGELQSNYGVPAYPQEYRITIKVAEEKSASSGGGGQGAVSKTPAAPAPEGAPKREKAPAAPRVGPEGSDDGGEPERPAKRRRGRRRRGRGRSPGPGGPDSNGSSSPPSAPPPPPPA